MRKTSEISQVFSLHIRSTDLLFRTSLPMASWLELLLAANHRKSDMQLVCSVRMCRTSVLCSYTPLFSPFYHANEHSRYLHTHSWSS